jgi:tRNA-splicing ligase RtcB
MDRVETRRVSDFLLEIPRSGRMRVPGRVFVSDALMQTQKADEAIKQVANVAELPGIVGYSMAMPDFHWGYGFPIGGVAAFDFDEGVISPGGVGFDVNCLSADSLCLTRFGYRRTIQTLVSRKLRESTAAIRASHQLDRAVVTAGVAKRPTCPVLELRTSTGRTLEATTDHPFQTPAGMKALGEIAVGERVAVWPFLGVDFEQPGGEIIVDEAIVRRTLRRIGKEGGNAPAQVLRSLRGRGLLPLYFDHPSCPIQQKIAV